MANLVKRYAESPPVEPSGHLEFEQFIRDLDAGRIGLSGAKATARPASRGPSPWPSYRAGRSSG